MNPLVAIAALTQIYGSDPFFPSNNQEISVGDALNYHGLRVFTATGKSLEAWPEVDQEIRFDLTIQERPGQ